MRTGHIHILRESASVLEMHENRGFTVRRKTHLGMQTTNEVHTQTHRSASSLLHMPELLNMHLTPGFKEYSVELKKRNFPRLLQSIYRQCVLWACSYTHASPKYTQGHTCTRFRHPYAQLPAFPALTNTFTPLLKCASSWSSCGNTPQKLMNLQYDLMSNLSEDAARLHTSALTLHQTSKSSELKHTGAGNKDRTIHSRSLQIFQYSTGKLLQPYVSIILAKRSKND